jgi:hypothetical protein
MMTPDRLRLFSRYFTVFIGAGFLIFRLNSARFIRNHQIHHPRFVALYSFIAPIKRGRQLIFYFYRNYPSRLRALYLRLNELVVFLGGLILAIR